MQQISLYLSGERDYTLIKGSTGPLVYPAAHVYSYTALYHLTDEGRDIFFGQILFAVLYLITLVVVLCCYRQSGAPPYLLPLLVLSKRLHSVYVLRLFNDGLAALAMWVAILLFMNRKWTAAVAVWSTGVAIKMTLLLLAPAIAVVTVLSLSLGPSVGLGVLAVLVQVGSHEAVGLAKGNLREDLSDIELQVLLAIPFLQNNPAGYLSRAFELTRQFMFKWTVNWRFVGEEVFLSKSFSLALLAVHIVLLGAFAVTGWLRYSRSSLPAFIRNLLAGRHRTVSLPKPYIMSVMLSSLTVGLLCARSLHYQFFAYLSWATPFLLWRAWFHPILLYLIWAMQEWAWNTFPSTNLSSIIVVLSLATQSFGVLANSASAFYTMRSNPSGKEHNQ